ncbi:hypothetical protein AAZX31_13G055100 [Glycine max]|nr:hypothetical protein GLYMA_13G069650v4 [Glycine max]KAH1100209.1 hypothetical protein GYH30_035390 [Glycine max]
MWNYVIWILATFLSPIRGKPKVMQRGRFFPEPMLPNSNKVKREAIGPTRACPVTINRRSHYSALTIKNAIRFC